MGKSYAAAISIVAVLLAAAVFLVKSISEQQIGSVPVSASAPTLAFTKKGDTSWLIIPGQRERLVLLHADEIGLRDVLTGTTFLDYRRTKADSGWHYQLTHNWKNRISYLLADPSVLDTTKQWLEARQKLIVFLRSDADSAFKNPVADTALIQRFVGKIDALQNLKRSTYLLDRMIYTDQIVAVPLNDLTRLSLATKANQKIWSWLMALCFVLAGGLGIAGWLRKSEVEIVASEDIQEPDYSTGETQEEILAAGIATENMDTLPTEHEMILRYARRFYEKYGHLFEDLQRQTGPITEAESKAVLRQLIEMALHAHTFAYYGIMDKYNRLNESPNARLLFENKDPEQLPPGQVKIFTLDAYQTESKYRRLFDILKAIDIAELEVLLEDQVYIPREFW